MYKVKDTIKVGYVITKTPSLGYVSLFISLFYLFLCYGTCWMLFNIQLVTITVKHF